MDRRTVWAILLMMVIAIVPAIFIKRPPRPNPAAATTAHTAAPSPAPATAGPAAGPVTRDSARAPVDSSAAGAPRVDTVRVTSPLYAYGVSTAGGRLVEARLEHYRSMAPEDAGATAQILPRESQLLGLTLVVGRDTIPLSDWPFTASAESLDVAGATPLRLSARSEERRVGKECRL